LGSLERITRRHGVVFAGATGLLILQDQLHRVTKVADHSLLQSNFSTGRARQRHGCQTAQDHGNQGTNFPGHNGSAVLGYPGDRIAYQSTGSS
jgi:hypothetical protein